MLITAAFTAAPGCGGGPAPGAEEGSRVCDAEAQCEGWAPAQADACYTGADNDALDAAHFNCGFFLDQLISCEETMGTCRPDHTWDPHCMMQRDSWNHCLGR